MTHGKLHISFLVGSTIQLSNNSAIFLLLKEAKADPKFLRPIDFFMRTISDGQVNTVITRRTHEQTQPDRNGNGSRIWPAFSSNESFNQGNINYTMSVAPYHRILTPPSWLKHATQWEAQHRQTTKLPPVHTCLIQSSGVVFLLAAKHKVWLGSVRSGPWAMLLQYNDSQRYIYQTTTCTIAHNEAPMAVVVWLGSKAHCFGS